MGSAVATTERRKGRSVLPLTEARRIRIRLTGTLNGQASVVGYVCSEPWARECIAALESGRLPAKRMKRAGIERALHACGVYPPGGSETSMVENVRTLRYMPPDYTGSPLDEREDRMSLIEGCRMPKSVSAVNIEMIRLLKLRPERRRIRASRK